ncbi:hypothetical protein [Tamlana sp. I1]|uniref:hypothetical protein n=1 Tax=Tamlana sp. I1 TaxID=2762061 RepID=UPI00188E864C|nr:hypothetical protein [Tamlana sp. I1]
MNTVTDLLKKIEQAKSLDFGEIFGESIELFKKTWLKGFILFLMTLVIMLPLIIILYIPLIGMIIAQGENGQIDDSAMTNFFGSMSILYILFVVVGIFVLGSITFVLNAGFYRIMKKIDDNEQVDTKDYFYFVKMQYLSKGLLILLISIVITIVSMMLCYIPFIYAIVPLSFFVVVFAFNPELSTGEIIKLSVKLANKNWLVAFGLIVVSTILSQIVGYLACGIGLLFTATFVYHPIYLIYKKVFGFNQIDVIDEIGATIE